MLLELVLGRHLVAGAFFNRGALQQRKERTYVLTDLSANVLTIQSSYAKKVLFPIWLISSS